MIEPYLDPSKYKDHSPNPIEFLCRGTVREEKDRKIRSIERTTEESKERLNECVQQFLQKEFKFYRNGEQDILKRSQSLSFNSRFNDWLNGKDRTLRLQQAKKKAGRMEYEAEMMDTAVKTINRVHNEYKTNASKFAAIALDAVYHDAYSKCGWTWWR